MAHQMRSKVVQDSKNNNKRKTPINENNWTMNISSHLEKCLLMLNEDNNIMIMEEAKKEENEEQEIKWKENNRQRRKRNNLIVFISFKMVRRMFIYFLYKKY